MRFEGIYTPVITPFNDDFSINFDAYATHVDYLKQSGVHGLMIGGTTGEYYVESHEEHVELLKVARDVVGKDLTIIFGKGSIDPSASIKLAEDSVKYGADSILVATPPYSVPTQRELAMHALSIDRASGTPEISLDNHKLISAIFAGFVAWKTRNLLFTIFVGMGVLFLLQNI